MLFCCYLLLWNLVHLPTTTTNEEQLVAVLSDILNGNDIVYLCFLKHGQPCCNLKPDLVNNIISKFQNTCFTCVRIIVWYEENAIIETCRMLSAYRLSGLDIWGHTHTHTHTRPHKHTHTHIHIITHRRRKSTYNLRDENRVLMFHCRSLGKWGPQIFFVKMIPLPVPAAKSC